MEIYVELLYCAGHVNSGVASSQFWEGSNILTLGEEQYLFWDTASRSI